MTHGHFKHWAAITGVIGITVLMLAALPGCKDDKPAVQTTAPRTTAPATTPATTPPATTPPVTTPPATTPPPTTAQPLVEPGTGITYTGVITTMSATSVVVAGKTFVINAATVVNPGMAVGGTATIECKLDDKGGLTATKVRAPGADDKAGEDFHVTGAITSIAAGAYVIGGQTFKTNAATMLDTGLVVGVTATVEFTLQADGSKLAKEIETKAQGAEAGEDFKFTGALQSKGATAWTIGGKTFLVNAATVLDQGLAVGVTATVEFIVQADGNYLAKQIETPAPDDQADNNFHFAGPIQSVSAGVYVIGGQIFYTNASTILDTGLVVGAPARVEFLLQPGGIKLATDIQTP